MQTSQHTFTRGIDTARLEFVGTFLEPLSSRSFLNMMPLIGSLLLGIMSSAVSARSLLEDYSSSRNMFTTPPATVSWISITEV